MHSNLYARWQSVLRNRAGAIAIIDAESGDSWTFREVDARAEEWLTRHPQLRDSMGRIWCLALSDRAQWLTVFLAAIKVGAVILSLEKERSEALLNQAERLEAVCLIEDARMHVLDGGKPSDGYFLIKQTSGTTGEPKSLYFTEAEMMADGEQIMRSMSISEIDRNFAVIPLGHSYGLGNLVMPFFMSGVAIVLGSSPFPQVMVEEMSRFSCTVLALVPPLVKALTAVELERESLPDLRLVISAGSALKPQVAARFHGKLGLRVHNFYGSSETGGICFDRSGKLSESDAGVGTPLDGVQLLIAEDQSIQVRSAAICHAVYPEGIANLHDFGQLNSEQVLRLTGRHADLFKIAGRRLSLSEIETALCAIKDVEDAYVSVRERRSGEASCVALFTGESNTESVRVALSGFLVQWKIPKILRKVEQIAYTARGKKDRKALERKIDELISQ